jgi:hypothetical protein
MIRQHGSQTEGSGPRFDAGPHLRAEVEPVRVAVPLELHLNGAAAVRGVDILRERRCAARRW